MAKLDPSLSIPTASSKSESWIVWHKDLKRMFGKKKANSIFVYAWAKRGGINGVANTNELRGYMDTQGVNISTTDFKEITDVVGNLLDFSFGIGKIVIIGTLSVVGLVLLSILIKLFKNPQQQLNLNTLPNPSPNKILTK